MDYITFQDLNYPIREVKFPFGCRTIGNMDLCNDLFSNDGSNYSNEVQFTDEKIFFFVENQVLDWKEEDIVKHILLDI
jgi:hypothetical protein